MSNQNIYSTSNSSESTSVSASLYETPMNSPTNESLLNSIAIDSSLMDRTSNITESIEFESVSNRSIQSTPISIETNSTLKAQQFNRDSNLLQSNSMLPTNQTLYEPMNQSMKCSQNNMSSIPESSKWFRRQTVPLTNGNIDSNVTNSGKYGLLLKYMEELDCEHLQMIGLEQQLNSISLQCKTIRENIVSKTNDIYSLINDIVMSKESAQKPTQTQQLIQMQTQTIDEESDSSQRDEKPFSGFSKSNRIYTSRKDLIDFTSNINSVMTNNSQKQKQTQYPIFAELSNDTKKMLSRLPALVKGYLTRRLMKTEKVVYIKNTIRDTTQLLINIRNSTNRDITPEDIEFHKRLIIQLKNGCHEFYEILMNYPKSAQMALITRLREHTLERQYRTGSVLSISSNITSNLNSSFNNSVTGGLSSVTRKILEKKLSNQNSSALNKYQSSSRPLSTNNSKKNSVSQSLRTTTEMSLSHDSSNRMNTSLRRSQRNSTKIKVITTKRKSPNKKK